MAYKYQKTSIDDNHNEVVSAFRRLGGVVTSTTCVKQFCDMVVAYNGHWILIEVKDGKKPPSQRKLTEREQRYHDDVSKVGCMVHIVESVEDVIKLIEIYK